MVEAGKSPTMIALRLKRTVGAVRGRLTVLRITIRKVHIKKNPAQIEAIEALKANGK
jgi:hypothetical protein